MSLDAQEYINSVHLSSMHEIPATWGQWNIAADNDPFMEDKTYYVEVRFYRSSGKDVA